LQEPDEPLAVQALDVPQAPAAKALDAQQAEAPQSVPEQAFPLE
jgi:hypothetical protein